MPSENELAETELADRNVAFMQVHSCISKVDHAKNVTIDVQPMGNNLSLLAAHELAGHNNIHYYTGRDQSTIHTFGSETTPLLCVSQSNPRRNLQLADPP